MLFAIGFGFFAWAIILHGVFGWKLQFFLMAGLAVMSLDLLFGRKRRR